MAKQRTFVVIGDSEAARTFFKSNGLRTSERLDPLLPESHVVVIWNGTHLTEDERRHAKTLCEFAGRGGRALVLSTPSWNWPELCDVKIGEARSFSRVFPYKLASHPRLSAINPDWLIRWKAFPGTVGLAPLEGPPMARADKLLWAREPGTTIAAMLPAAEGEGRIIFAQLEFQRRLDPSKPNYDPAAERLLLNLLGAQTSK